MNMKKKYAIIFAVLISFLMPSKGAAQYTSIVNQAASLMQTAIMGGMRYRGYVDASYMGGFGRLQADFVGISTVQGVQYADWFFMGAGLGVDLVYSKTDGSYNGWFGDRKTRTSGAMVPIFTDFRFNIGGNMGPSFYIDIKAGGSFLIGKKYLAIENGYINGSEYFMLKPSIGLRVPVSKDGRRSMNIGLTYQLLTCNYWWYNNSNSGTLNSLGGTVSYQW
ncbi:MAG: hypothetical protein K2I92_00025 [Muribaculaceae bacterium]|nr:hypothetical protein [Muribaculaceae bacterium]